MSDRNGQASTLNVLLPLLPEHADLVRAYLEQLPKGDAYPLAALGTTHFTRWTVLDRQTWERAQLTRGGLQNDYLIFTAIFDGDTGAYVEALRTRAGTFLDTVFGHCVGYPGATDAAGFGRYLRHNRVPADCFYTPYPDYSLAEILEGLRVREALIDFAVGAQDLDAEALQAAFNARFA